MKPSNEYNHEPREFEKPRKLKENKSARREEKQNLRKQIESQLGDDAEYDYLDVD